MIRVRLQEMMRAYRRRTGERMSYERLALMTGLSRGTLAAIGSYGRYNTTLLTIEKLCRALGCKPADLLVLENDIHDDS